MKTEFLKSLGLSDEDVQKILAENGKDIEREKAKTAEANEEIKTLKEDKKSLEEKITELTENAQSAEEYKTQLETLQKEIKEKEEKDEADRIAKEKAESVANRFGAVLGEKKFTHEAIKADYLKKFGDALENKDFEGKSDSEIFHELTKDDGTAFEGVSVFKLEGGTNKGIGGGSDADLGKLSMADYIAARNEMKG